MFHPKSFSASSFKPESWLGLLVASAGQPHRVYFVDEEWEPKLWWQRKPKAVSDEDAAQKVQKVARTIERVVKAKVESKQEPSKQAVKQAIAPVIAEMPGFDWNRLYQEIRIKVTVQMLEAEQDEEEALILLMS